MSSNGQINQQQQPQNATLLFSGPGHAAQILSVNAENFAMRNDELSLIQELHGDGQGIPLTRPTSGSSLNLDMQGQGTASSLVPPPMLPTFRSATQAAGDTHIHGQPAQLAVIQPASTQSPSNALLPDGSRLPSSAEALAEQTNIPIELAQQIMDDAMSQRRFLSENQQLMDALARVCPECSTAVIILLLEMLDRERRTVIEHEERQAMAKQIVELRTVFDELAAKLAEIRQDGRGDDSRVERRRDVDRDSREHVHVSASRPLDPAVDASSFLPPTTIVLCRSFPRLPGSRFSVKTGSLSKLGKR